MFLNLAGLRYDRPWPPNSGSLVKRPQALCGIKDDKATLLLDTFEIKILNSLKNQKNLA